MDNDSKYSNRSETDRIFPALDSLSQTAETTATDTLSTSEQSILTMLSLGKTGRFGNQLFQYAFLQICARQAKLCCRINLYQKSIMIRLLVVDDQSLVCQGLKAMLELEPDLQVVGTADNGETAIEQVAALQPELVLMDVRMPVMDGREATRIINQQFPDVKVLILSTFDDDQYIAEAMRAGARGYLLKDMPSEELAQAIRFVNRGYAQLGPGLMEKLIKGVPISGTTGPKSDSLDLTQLTPREQDVLRLIGFGSTNREIAQDLYIAEGTVKTHVTHLLNHLNLRNRVQLAIYANSVCWAGVSKS
ncbi:Two-component transcriptional response regulator, LuxR family [uncultured Synechococcales cyanobacterium]|uniref:Two-component transcriptional response regulator, LuxR family n=1 Tax=uncultured Synechococcales cyanobacterium TaxID=1936017 RepID=A0A6N3IPG8_9CYAN|nr:Two-component transcriptional response regulator, LuxR family [uncultured Synechococcales cyanobacterium]